MTAPVHPRETLSAWRDGELDQRERAAVAAHLRDCAACTRELEQLARVDALLAARAADRPTSRTAISRRCRAASPRACHRHWPVRWQQRLDHARRGQCRAGRTRPPLPC